MASREIVPASAGELVPANVGDDAGLAALAEGLVSAARAQGVQLTGPGGLLTGLTRQVLESALKVEMAEHLGYEHSDPSGHGSGNSRNGTSSRRSAPTSVMSASMCPVIAWARSLRRWSRSINGDWRASTTRCCRCMPRE